MKWVVAIAAALLLETGLAIALWSIQPPRTGQIEENAKPEAGIPVVFREGPKAVSGGQKQVTPVRMEVKKASAAAQRASDTAVNAAVARTVSEQAEHAIAVALTEKQADLERVAAHADEQRDDAASREQGAGSANWNEQAANGCGDQGNADEQGASGGADAGSGDGLATGSNSRGTNGGTSAAADLSAYGKKLLARIAANRRVLPQMQRLRLQGTATVTLQVGRDGSVKGMRISQSAGHALLDGEAMRMVRDAAPFAPLPNGYPEEMASFSVPVNFRTTN